MSDSVCRNHAVAVVDARIVIAQTASEKICESTARFSQNDLRSARVPLFCARRKMQIEIGLSLSNQTNLHTDGTAACFMPESEGVDDAFHPGTTVRSA